MTLHRFFVPAEALDGDRVTLGSDQARQIATVLRLSPGDRIVAVHDGIELEATIGHLSPSVATAMVVERRPCPAEPRLRVTLAVPLLRGDHSEEIVEAAVQLGVAAIVPLVSERSVVRDLSSAKRARWERIALEAAETARRGRIPEVAHPVAWDALFERLPAPVFVPWEEERGTHLARAVEAGATALSLVIGPEGGISPAEIAVARERGARIVTLGSRTLRSETAAIAAVAIAFALAEP